MLKNYLITSLRNLVREKANTLINILGLTLGISGSLVLFLIIQHGSSYDRYHTRFDRIYRLTTQSKGNQGVNFTQGVPAVLPEAFRNDFADAEEVAFTSYRRGALITVVQDQGRIKKYEEPKGLVFTEPSLFRIFDRKIISGSDENALANPNQAIISRKWAQKYYGKEDVIGELLEYENSEYAISAVMEDFPVHSDFPFDLMLSYVTIKKSLDGKGWNDISDTDNCYFLLKPGLDPLRIEAQLPAFVKTHLGDNPSEMSFIVQPLSTLHSDNRFGNYNTKLPREAQIVFAVIALFLIITTCINFINLTTAEAVKRVREVGIRKILGSTRRQLILQFTGETFMVTLFAVFVSLGVSQLLLGLLNPFLEITLTLGGSGGTMWLFLISLAIAITLMAGLYPAFLVSASKPVLALKNQLTSQRASGQTVRKSLIVVQFFISQLLVVATIVIYRQLDFIQKQDVGFVREAIVTLPIPLHEESSAGQSGRMRVLKDELAKLSGIEKISLNYAPPSYKAVVGTRFSLVESRDEFDTQVKHADGDYLNLFNIPVVAGEGLEDLDTVAGLVVNEKLVQTAGLSNEAIIGKKITFWGRRFPVRGVVKNFNTTSLSQPIEPVVLLNGISGYQHISIKLDPMRIHETMQQIESTWEATYPEYIFSYSFLDEQIRDLYKGERRTSVLLTIFSSIAIFIGCLGLYGLVAFMANQKTKEIGIRKILGATVNSIVRLFSWEFIRLIIIGFALATPVAWYLLSKLLEQFAYKITLGPLVFMAGLSLTLLIALMTVGLRAYRASTANPVQSLRTE